MINILHRSVRKTALPRTGRELDAVGGAVASSDANMWGGTGSSYFQLITADAEGNPIPEDKQYIITNYTVVSKRDVVAYEEGEIEEIEAKSSPTTYGLMKYNPEFFGLNSAGQLTLIADIGGGIDEKALSKYLDDNHYLTPSKPLYGYVAASVNPIIKASDTVNGAFKKIETEINLFGGKMKDYVTTNTDQTITGQKRFTKTGIFEGDVIAYAVDETIEDVEAVASSTTFGLIKYDPLQFGLNSSRQLTIIGDVGGGISNIVSAGSGNAVTSMSYNGASKIITYTKGITFVLPSDIPTALRNPYALSWSGYSSGSYDGSSSRSFSIPSSTSQLSNGAGFITGINLGMVNSALQEVGNKYIGNSGNGNFINVQEDIRILKSCDFSSRPRFGGSTMAVQSDLTAYVTLATTQTITGAKTFTQNLVSQGDVVAYSATGSIGDVEAVASSSTFGLVKFDNSTIKMNAYNQLYVAAGMSGSTAWVDVTNKPAGLVTNVSVNGSGNAIGSASFYAGTLSLTYTTISGGGGGTVNLAAVNAALQETGPKYIGNYNNGSFISIQEDLRVLKGCTFVSRPTMNGVGFALLSEVGGGGGGSWDGGTVNNRIFAPSMSLNTSSSSYQLYCNGAGLFVNNSNTSAQTYIYGNTINTYATTTSAVPRLWLNYYKNSGWGSKQTELFIGNGNGAGTVVVSINSGGDGKVLALNGTGTLSDMRYKDRVRFFDMEVLSVINQFVPFYYTLKEDERKTLQIGYSAQTVQRLIPEFVVGSDRLSLDYERFGSVVAIKGLQELYGKHLDLDNFVKSRAHWERTKDYEIDQLRKEIVALKLKLSA